MTMKPYIAVLVIEDSLDDFFFLKQVLKSTPELSAEVHHANRLADGLAIVERERIDVAILDLSLPDSFGLDTFQAFHEHYPLIPTIILSGHKDHDLAFEAVQKGAQDYLFKGEPSSTAIIRTIRYAIERQGLMSELKRALDHVHQLQGMLPICMMCKKVRDDQGYWNQIESYISKYSRLEFSHGLCPECAKTHYPDVFKDKEPK
jgi:DNA-binding NtrC family response regulator